MRIRLTVILLMIFLMVTCSHPLKNETANKYESRELTVPDHQTLLQKAEWIDSIFTKMSKHHWFNGAIIYGEKGHVIYKNAFGFSNFRTKDTLTINSTFQLASVSKMITAMSVMILIENGRLSYDDTLQMYIPGFPYRGVTIKQLLIHRSGLSRYMSLADQKWYDKKIPFNNGDMLDLYQRYRPKLYFQPDNGFHYCNTNYALLASVVEKVSGQPFDVFVKDNIFDPLEMNNSFVYNLRNDSIVPVFTATEVMGHRYWKWKLIRKKDNYLNGVMGDKGVYASVEDLFKFDQALNNFTLVGDSTLSRAFSPGSPKYWRRKDNYGFGWRIKTAEDSTVYHFGWWKGFRAYYIRDMKQEKTIIALSNKDKGPGSDILWKIIRDTTHVVKFNNFFASELNLDVLPN